MSQALVLSVGSDPAILGTRELILRSAGHIVVSAISIQEAVHLFQNGDFDLIILCHTVPQRDCERLASLIRASGSRIPIVRVSGIIPGEHNAFADATLDSDPAVFLTCLGDVLSRHAAMRPAAFSATHINGEAASAEKPSRSDGGSRRQKRGAQENQETAGFLKRTRERVSSQ